MEWKFDSTGFKFIVKFIGQLVLLYFLTAFFSSFIFSNLYENREYVSKNRRENREGPISSRGKNVGSAYSFRMDTRVVSGLKFAGFDALTVANNHSGNWGKEAFSDTLLI